MKVIKPANSFNLYVASNIILFTSSMEAIFFFQNFLKKHLTIVASKSPIQYIWFQNQLFLIMCADK